MSIENVIIKVEKVGVNLVNQIRFSQIVSSKDLLVVGVS